MASKMPYMQFYVNDFDNDTKGVSSLAVGVWIRILINMHIDGVGSITGTLDKLAKMTRCTVEELQSAIPELISNNIAEIADADAKKTLESQDCHALSHAVVTLICRRMKRDEEKRKLASIRKQRERMSRDGGEYCHADVTQKDNSLSRGNHAIRAPKESESESESEYKKEKQKKKNFSFVGVGFFPEKFKTEKFIEAWQEWETFRREKRCTLTESTAKKQLSMLADFEENEAIAILDKSITNGWQGLFPESVKKAENEELSAIEKIERGIPV